MFIFIIREHPFNLKGGGGPWFFMGENILSANLIEKQFLSQKYCFCRKKKCRDNLTRKKHSAALRGEKNYFDSEKTIAPPPPLS